MDNKKEIIEVTSKTFEFLKNLKTSMGKSENNWDDWFSTYFNLHKATPDAETIEQIFQNATYEKYYDEWIQNFTNNLFHIWSEHSASELKLIKTSNPSSLVIGRGPSIKKNNHLEVISQSDYDGTIVCCDGSLANALNAGITPDKFPNFYVITIDSQQRQKLCYDHDIVRQHGQKIKCIFSTTVSPLTYMEAKKSNMEIYWLNTLFDYNNGKNSFNYISNHMIKTKNHTTGLPAIQTGGNVGTSAWVVSWAILKKSVIGLIGIDHGYSSDDRTEHDHLLPQEIDRNSAAFKRAYPILYNPEFDCYCQQDPIFQYYSNAFKEFIERTSSKIKTINATEGGALFGKFIECMTLKEFLRQNTIT